MRGRTFALVAINLILVMFTALLFQNCSSGLQSARTVESGATDKASGNGSGHDGKLKYYYAFNPKECTSSENLNGLKSIIQIQDKRATLLWDACDPVQATAVNSKEIGVDAFQHLISFKDVIFERLDLTPQDAREAPPRSPILLGCANRGIHFILRNSNEIYQATWRFINFQIGSGEILNHSGVSLSEIKRIGNQGIIEDTLENPDLKITTFVTPRDSGPTGVFALSQITSESGSARESMHCLVSAAFR